MLIAFGGRDIIVEYLGLKRNVEVLKNGNIMEENLWSYPEMCECL